MSGIRECSIDGCDRTGKMVRGMCNTHYLRMWSRGTPDLAPPVLPLTERLAAGLHSMPSGCIEWTGATDSHGYGQIKMQGKLLQTHRLSWELVNGPIPEGVHVLHKCDNPPCCNVEKCLFLGTHVDNMADMVAKGRSQHGALQRAKTHCPQGHPYDEVNTYVSKQGGRACRTCNNERSRIRRAS